MINEFARMQKLAGLVLENKEHYIDAEKDDAAHIAALEKDMKHDAKHTHKKGKIKMSELKAAIKELYSADENLNEGTWSVLPDRIPEFLKALEDLKDEYYDVVGDDEVYNGLDAAEMRAKELMNSKLDEAKKDKEEDTDTDVDMSDDEGDVTANISTDEVDPEVKAVQDALTQAQAAAEKLGDEKLTDQIGNTITFFTRAHIVEKPGVAASHVDENMDEYEDDEYDIDAAFKSSPEYHSYDEVLDIVDSYEDEGMIEDFESHFPKGKKISKKDYYDFCMQFIDDMSEASYIKANWIDLTDPDVFEKAGLI